MKTFIKILLLVSGFISLILAIIGILLPLLPTTPFLLLSAYCFAKSSEKFRYWLLNNRYFGKTIDDYQQGKGVSKKIKITALVFMWLSILSSCIFLVSAPWLQILLICIAIGVTWHVLKLKTR